MFANVHQAVLHSGYDVREYHLDALMSSKSFGSSVPAFFLYGYGYHHKNSAGYDEIFVLAGLTIKL